LLVWQQEAREGQPQSIRASLQNSGRLDEPTVITESTQNWLGSPVATPLGDGYLVAWEADGLDGSLGGIFGAQVDERGAVVVGPVVLNTYTEGNQREPAAAGGPDGQGLVVWTSPGHDGIRTEISGRLVVASTPLGDPRGREFRISEPSSGWAQNPRVAGYRGGYWVAWEEREQGQSKKIRLRHFNRQGVAVGRELRIAAEEGEQVQLLDIEAVGSDRSQARWWRLDRAGRFLGTGSRDARPSGQVLASDAN
jgi:hypothetical protein